MDTEVLIVGAGPTGLMLANQLSRRGVRIRIIDRNSGPAMQSRALGVQARTLEIYSHLGLAEAALALGKRATGANLWGQGRLQARIPLGDIGRDLSPYPFLLILGQDDNEHLLGENLRHWKVEVEWNTALVGLTPGAHQVQATLKQPDGSIRELSAGWVAGCDGVHSAVRELNHIEFPGAPYEQVFFLADTQITGAMVPDELNVYLWRRGFHLFFPMRGENHWRLVGILPANLRGREDLTFEDVIPAVRAEAGKELAFHETNWFSTYRIHHRRAEQFRKGRCFLLGDAAHVHSPVGAQGMNTGLQDAYNLAWKLALVVSGRCDESLLDSYAEERIPVAQRLLQTTDRAFSAIVSDHWFAGWLRTKIVGRLVAFLTSLPPVRQFVFRTISQTGIQYRTSRLSVTPPAWPKGAPQAGDRFPWLRLQFTPGGPIEDLYQKLDDTKFTLILFGQSLPGVLDSRLGDLLQLHAISDSPANESECRRAQIPSRSYFLVRPDGHVGLAGTLLQQDALNQYLSDRLRFL